MITRAVWTIYALSDPHSGEVKYVGYTSIKPESRLSKHMANCRSNRDTPVYRWLRGLGERPTLTILEQGTGDWREAETKWITKFDGLLNVLPGGQTCIVPPESRKAAADKLRGRKRSPETCRRISEAKKGHTSPRPD